MAADWVMRTLRDLVDVRHGFAFQGEFIREDPSRDILLTPGNFAIGGGFKDGKFKYYDGPVTDEFILLEGDLIVTMTDLSKESATLGYPAFVPRRRDGRRYLHNQRLGKIHIRDPHAIDLRYLHHVMRGSEYRHEVLASATGTTVKHTSPERIRRFRFLCPPISEQRAIAHVLGILDDKIELNRRMNETLEAMARAIFQSWFVDFDPVRAKTEGRDPSLLKPLADLFPAGLADSELGEIPAGWSVGPFLRLGRLLSGGTPRTDRNDYWNGNIAWATAKDVSQSGQTFLVQTERSITQGGLEESSTQLIPAFSSVVVARGATTGRLVMLGREMAMNQTCYALTTSGHTPFSLYCFLRTEIDNLVHAAHGSVFDTITTTTFERSKVILPSDSTLLAFEQVSSPLFHRILANIEESGTLGALRDALLPKLISGEIRIKDAERMAVSVT